MFESKIHPDDLAILKDQWDRDGHTIISKDKAQEVEARVNRVENAVRNLVLALSGTTLMP